MYVWRQWVPRAVRWPRCAAFRSKSRTRSPINNLIDLFVAGDAVAHRTLDQAGTSLGRAIANALNLIDIDQVILGGDLAHLLPHVEKLLYSEVSYRMRGSRWVETELVADTHGARAAVLGARHASFEDFVENP
ncbi:ROK family protein [Trueperella pyogenes]